MEAHEPWLKGLRKVLAVLAVSGHDEMRVDCDGSCGPELRMVE